MTLALALGMLFREALHQTPYQIGEYALFLPLYLASGWGVLSVAGRNIRRGQVFDENFLMAVATLAAIAIHELPEAVGVMLFYRLGELLQDRAVGGSRRSVESLLAVRPDVARVERDGQLQTVSPEAVAVGERIQLKPGERIPLDGEVLAGSAQIDTSALTGESRPQAVEAGGSVWAGTINQTGVLTVRVTRPFAHSSIAKV
ncbi:MAG: heavy metal translocating P-type ATPase, partial [Cyanobacteria bacterium QS_8_64_29]